MKKLILGDGLRACAELSPSPKKRLSPWRSFLPGFLCLFLIIFPAFAQETERTELNGSALYAGAPFSFTVTLDTDSSRSFADAQLWMTAVLCPVDRSLGACQSLPMSAMGAPETTMRLTFYASALPAGGDYTLDINFTDVNGSFEQTTASYLLKGIRADETQPVFDAFPTAPLVFTETSTAVIQPTEIPVTATVEMLTGSDPTPTAVLPEETETAPTVESTEEPIIEPTDEPTEEYIIPGSTDIPEIEPELPTVEISVMLEPSLRDADGNMLIYGSTLYVGEEYIFFVNANYSMNDNVDVVVNLPASLQNLPIDPYSECLYYMSADGATLTIPGSRFMPETNNSFNCSLRFDDSVSIAANPVTLQIEPSGHYAGDETFTMIPMSWNYYPVSITKFAATHQAQITDSRGNLICSDTVACAVFNTDDVYTLTYKFPADWGEALPSGKTFFADLIWPADWGMGIQLASDWETAAMFGEVCSVGPDGMSHLGLHETSAGRYTASCTFTAGGISNPSQSAVQIHLDDNSYNVNDLNVYLPASIIRQQAVLSPSLTLQIIEGYAPEEQIRGGSIGTLYRATEDYPNLSGGYGSPALYTLKARVEGVSHIRTPQWNDHIQVNWTVFDAMANMGDLPMCLTPNGDGYELGTLAQTEDGAWEAECSFRFPRSLSEDTAGGALSMELVSGMYSTSANIPTVSQPFAKQTLAVNLDVPTKMAINQTMRIYASLSDDSGGLTDYTRAVLANSDAQLYSDWAYNDVTSCYGLYDLTAGDASCDVLFNFPVEASSLMSFSLESAGLEELYNVEFRPSADIWVSEVSRLDVSLTPSLVFRMGPGSDPVEQINSGWIGTLYRTAGDMPNVYGTMDGAALYTLCANISGLAPDSVPGAGDYVLVNWPLLDELANAGDLPTCLMPAADGYQLGVLEQNGETGWTASCDFYFPLNMAENVSGSLTMSLVSDSYQGSGSAQMSGNAFHKENLYVDLDIPEHMLPNQMTEFHVKVSDSSGSLSDYARAILNTYGVTLVSDWDYNYLTTCQGYYELEQDGTSTCSALFDTPVNVDSVMLFELLSPGLENLFDVTYRPSAEIHIDPISNPAANLSVKLFHAGIEMALPASDGDAFEVGEDYQFQFYLTPDDEYRDVLDAVAVDNEGLVIDWWEPLRLHWGMIPGGETSLNFYRDGGSFIARYNFSFDHGDLNLEGNLGELVTECWIDGWDISGISDMEPIQLPMRVDKKTVTLELSAFKDSLTGAVQQDVYVEQNVEFDVTFHGSLEHLDTNQLIVGYDANGITTPATCVPDYESGVLHCSFIPQCVDFTYDDFPLVCGSNLSLTAEYLGDPYNSEAAAELRTFNIKRAEVRFIPFAEASLSKNDLFEIQDVAPDLQSYISDAVIAGGWMFESFLPKEIRTMSETRFPSYPIVFRYEKTTDMPLEESRLWLDVKFQTGQYNQAEDEVISLHPRSVTDDTVYFDLDFGSFELLDDGRAVDQVLANAVTITALEVRYAGSTYIGPATAAFQAENLTFAIKLASLLDLNLDISIPGTLRFDGAVSAEMMTRSFRVYCTQLYQPLQCSAEAPLEVLNENGEPILSEIVTDGCWGKVLTNAGEPVVYVNDSVYPQCYLTAYDDAEGILFGAEF